MAAAFCYRMTRKLTTVCSLSKSHFATLHHLSPLVFYNFLIRERAEKSNYVAGWMVCVANFAYQNNEICKLVVTQLPFHYLPKLYTVHMHDKEEEEEEAA
jgi:hypothetical protein